MTLKERKRNIDMDNWISITIVTLWSIIIGGFVGVNLYATYKEKKIRKRMEADARRRAMQQRREDQTRRLHDIQADMNNRAEPGRLNNTGGGLHEAPVEAVDDGPFTLTGPGDANVPETENEYELNMDPVRTPRPIVAPTNTVGYGDRARIRPVRGEPAPLRYNPPPRGRATQNRFHGDVDEPSRMNENVNTERAKNYSKFAEWSKGVKKKTET